MQMRARRPVTCFRDRRCKDDDGTCIKCARGGSPPVGTCRPRGPLSACDAATLHLFQSGVIVPRTTRRLREKPRGFLAWSFPLRHQPLKMAEQTDSLSRLTHCKGLWTRLQRLVRVKCRLKCLPIQMRLLSFS